MQRLLQSLAIVLLTSLSLSGALLGGATKARLLLSAETTRPGDTVIAALELRMAPGWHTYWRNGGDSGMPTKISWHLPPGITAGEIQWPSPEKYTDNTGLTTYIYHDQALLLVPLTLSQKAASGALELQADVSWLECEKLCVPGSAKVKANLIVGSESKASSESGLIQAWQKRVPIIDSTSQARAFWDNQPSGDTRPLVIEWNSKTNVKDADFYPYASEDYEVSPATERLPSEAGKIWLRKKIKKLEGDWPKEIQGILVGQTEGGKALASYEVKLPLAQSETSAAKTLQTHPSKEKRSLAEILAFAFLGGLILNVMPCVLPVIALKILGFVNQSKEAPQQVRKLGLIYAVGVLVSFLILAAIIIAVQQAGHIASWGMQFSNPQFLVVMTVLVTLVALNLFGVFEINLSGTAMGVAGDLAAKEGNTGAFFNGVLATTLATPCTAPFLAPALGYAFAQPPAIVVLTFLTIGLGLAAPYVVLSWQPAWLKYLPKPGAWMQRFKVAMGFPMLATAFWVFTLTARRLGESALLWLGLFLVVLALAAWIWGEFVQRGRARKGLAIAFSLVVVAVGYAYILEGQLRWRSPAPSSSSAALQNRADGIQWQPWSATAVQRARAEGRPVLVDFTADWCLTCKANKKFSIEIPTVIAKLKAINAVTLLADNTNTPSEIIQELKRFDRAGVPLVLVYPKSPAAEPIVLPEILTPQLVLQALEKAVM